MNRPDEARRSGVNLLKKKKPRTKDEYLRLRGNATERGTDFYGRQDEKDLVQRSENFRKWRECPKIGLRGYALELVRKVTDRIPIVSGITVRRSPEVAGRVRNPLFCENACVKVKANDPAPRSVLTAEKRTGAKYESHYDSDSGPGIGYGSDPAVLPSERARNENALTRTKSIYSNIQNRFGILSRKVLRRTDDMGGGATYAAVSLLLASILTVLIMVCAGVFIPGTAIGTVISCFFDGPAGVDDGISPKQAVQILLQERDESIRGIEYSVKHDRVEYDVQEPEWLEIFAVYSVLSSADGNETVNLMSFDENGVANLRRVFAALYRVEYRTETEVSQNGTEKTFLYIFSVSDSLENTVDALDIGATDKKNLFELMEVLSDISNKKSEETETVSFLIFGFNKYTNIKKLCFFSASCEIESITVFRSVFVTNVVII